MSAASTEGAEYTEQFDEVAGAEAAWIAQRRAAADISREAPLVGLALSGGGIRSAAFNLGVLQALAQVNLLRRIDYLSSVSGGGYIASCLTWLSAHAPTRAPSRFDALPLAHRDGTVLDWLRAHGRYLITGRGLSGWSLAANILAGTLLNVFVLLPLFLFAIGVASRDWFALAWPGALHLPRAGAVHAHDGFMLIALAGIVLLALYLLTALLFALSTALPVVRRLAAEAYFRRGLGHLLAAGIAALAIGLLPVFTGIEEMAIAYLRDRDAGEIARQGSWLAPMLSGAASMWLGKRRANDSTALPIVGLSLLLYGAFTGLYHLAHHTALLPSAGFHYWLLASLVLAFVGDINAVSMHSYYRSRLAEAFLPRIASSETISVRESDPQLFRLTDVSPQSAAPFHIINTTLNTTSSKNQKRRSRSGENMMLTPLYCGSTATGFRRTDRYLRGQLTLATAYSVSGAAVDPDTYATSSRSLSFLMTLLNVRLGVWVANPRTTPRHLRWPAWYQLMLREMLGVGLSEVNDRIHLSDGGHFENLGVYELVRRKCKYILVSDAGADPQATLADLGQAVQRARADFGASIDICADTFFNERNEALPERSHLLGTIRYADGTAGEILYLKARLRKHLSADVYAYWRSNPQFPNQATSNQFYGELQFDAYRELGLQLMAGVIGESAAIEEVFERWDERALPLGERAVA